MLARITTDADLYEAVRITKNKNIHDAANQSIGKGKSRILVRH